MALFLMIIGALLLWSALHPFTTYPVSLWALQRWQKRRPEAPRSASLRASDVAICMCAYNEERVIDAKMANLLALERAHPGVEILIYVDAASDRTAERLRAYGDEIRLVVATERHGKTHGMNLLVSMVTKPIILFTDANVMIDLEAPARLMRYFADPTIGCVSGHLRYTNAEASVTAHTGSLYWRLEEWTKRLESRTGSAIGADGSLFAIRRELHRPPPDHIIDDMYVSMMIYCEGHRVVQADDVIAYEESVTVAGEELHRKVRIGCCAYNVHRVLWPYIREANALSMYKYVSHKWMRWCTIFFLIASAGVFESGLLLGGHALIAACLVGLGTLGLLLGASSERGPLAQLWDILSALAATGLGVLQSLRGQRFQTWTPAGSIRK
jgi:cellulose synthase/poly-beta-1,6-N-acetylglucosamine synthase-like glycosyltransferase